MNCVSPPHTHTQIQSNYSSQIIKPSYIQKKWNLMIPVPTLIFGKSWNFSKGLFMNFISSHCFKSRVIYGMWMWMWTMKYDWKSCQQCGRLFERITEDGAVWHDWGLHLGLILCIGLGIGLELGLRFYRWLGLRFMLDFRLLFRVWVRVDVRYGDRFRVKLRFEVRHKIRFRVKAGVEVRYKTG